MESQITRYFTKEEELENRINELYKSEVKDL